MEKETDKKKKIEELNNFPFKNFKEFQKKCLEAIAQPRVDRGVAFKWAQNGIYTSKLLRIQTTILTMFPFLATIGFLIYIFISNSWLLLLALPLLFVGFIIFHPSFAMIFGIIRNGLIALTLVGLFWALWKGKPDIIAMTLTLSFIWYAEKTIYKNAVDALLKAVIQHEDLLCVLWQQDALNISFYNGNRYHVDYKFEDGQYIDYEK